ncbi:MAG TPA: ABC transporter permease [Pyrinomonadaceae bacterium]|jgi:putative ABC transport system permease protein|nr:ABC transporter permease [Pyrinomonadaceae bacterium]
MYWLRFAWLRLRGLLRKEQVEDEMDAELRFHLMMRARENVRDGMTPERAVREARRRFGSLDRVKDAAREIKGGGMLETLLQDVRYGVRMMRKSPAFTLIAVLTLAAGVGANTAIFSVVNAVLLKSLPYHNSQRLVIVLGADRSPGPGVLSPVEAQDFAARLTTLEDFAAVQSQSVNLTGGARPERVRGAFVTANFFEVFNLLPTAGRTFARGEDGPGAERVAVVNEGFWRRRLNSAAELAGLKLILNGEPYSVVGVVPDSFRQPFDAEVEVWTTVQRFPGYSERRDARFLFGMGHLKPGVTQAQAQAEADAVAAQMAQAFPNESAGRGAKVELLQERAVKNIRPILLALFAAVGCILLIACSNLANLTLARGTARQKEFALRSALGAGRGRLVRQLLTETTLLALLGGGTGLLLARWGVDLLLAVNPDVLPRAEVRIDAAVLLFTLGASVLTGLLFGLAPAWQMSRFDLNKSLKEGGRAGGEGAGANRARGVFIVVQMALALVLLVGGALFIKSFYALLQVDPGFKPENLLTLEYRLPRNKYAESAAQWEFHRRVVEQLRAVPGVQSAALIRGLPLTGNSGSARVALPDGETAPKGQEPQVQINTATPDYFATMGIPFVKGRLFDDGDRLDTPAVFVVNQTMARRLWPNQDPVGRQIKILGDDTVGTVVGVVGDAKHDWLSEEQRPQLYDCYSQSPGLFATVVVRTKVEPMSLAQAVREAVWKVDKDQPVWKVRTVEALMAYNVADKRFLMLLMVVFAGLALTITAVGLYGVVNYTVGRRTHEIGIRMALGARAADVLRLVVSQGMRLAVAGVGVGLIASFVLTRFIQSLLFGVSPTDALTFAGVAMLLGGVALLACYVPARRATKVDPLIALRHE